MTTILVVDDEFSIVDTVCEILTWEGFQCVGASNGENGLAALERQRPDLVLLDYMMPVKDGLQMLKAMKQHPEHRRIPVILMTAAAMDLPQDERRWDALLRKPFEIDRLLKVIQEQLRKHPPQA